ncbi:MAG: ABC transporter ATP-binding protein [Methanoregula sp.]|jgi:fluoroquinolone transport system ATP-binding protein|uniref:ABC transporter ATP-binding protein n=1 Tax=Methanoregula sp. TaxID=2052170 RepID=UPI0025D8848C|nr:ABC transporter ATP-binding protein [Methanoregula sp.]MCK9630209.1 ABC transporter ATP-binding protein [Methanoregula sp.]
MITVNDLSFSYPGASAPSVGGISFSIQKGEIFGFLGPNGAGKSTTQKILIGLLRGYSGNVSVLGKKLDTWSSDYYEQIGVCFELPNHYPKLTARENLALFESFYTKKTTDINTLLRMVGLEQDMDKLVGSFSKGMKMKLNLARSLLHDPQILFLDEPTSGLDPASARLVKDIIIRKKNEGKTIFLTTHNMALADELCNRVSFMVNGKIAVTESPHILKVQFGKRIVRVEYQTGTGNQSSEFPLDGLGSNKNFFDLLNRADIRSLHTDEATLEDIFLSVTGRGLQ